jgi:hypothetical protein
MSVVITVKAAAAAAIHSPHGSLLVIFSAERGESVSRCVFGLSAGRYFANGKEQV